MKNLKPNEIYAVSAMTIDNNTEGVKTLITKYGVILPKMQVAQMLTKHLPHF